MPSGNADTSERSNGSRSPPRSASKSRARPAPIQTGHVGRVPLREELDLNRKDSKGGLRAMFTRTKTDRRVASPVYEEPRSAVSGRPARESDSRQHAGKDASWSIPSTPLTPSFPLPFRAPSRLSFRPKSTKPSQPTKHTPKAVSAKSAPRPPPRTSAAWDPPPLFQAFPQAIRHAQLPALNLSADAILRTSHHKRHLSQDTSMSMPEPGSRPPSAMKERVEKAKSKHRRQHSGAKADWTEKTFVLVTSGYLLQYAGEGSFDRLPEKMMQLGKDSVAFASDVIPGKHWVLQISQNMNADGAPASDARSLMSRLTSRGADYKRTTTSLLLVLGSAEELDSWMATMRREIEALGGKKHESETGTEPESTMVQLTAVKPVQSGAPISDSMQAWTSELPEDAEAYLAQASEDARIASQTFRPPSSYRSRMSSLASTAEQHLESLQDSNRYSYMSTDQRTVTTSDGSTQSGSVRNSFFLEETQRANLEFHLRPNAAAVNERRRSMQSVQTRTPDAGIKKSRPQSTFDDPSRANRLASPSTPNFSVPVTCTKRFSSASASRQPFPPLVTNDTSPGTRKPPSVNSKFRNASPSSKQKKSSMMQTPEGSLRNSVQSKPSMEVKPRSPSMSPNGVGSKRSVSSFGPTPSDVVESDVRLGRRHSSMQLFKKTKSEKEQLRQFVFPARETPILRTDDAEVLEGRSLDASPKTKPSSSSPRSKNFLHYPVSVLQNRKTASPSPTSSQSKLDAHGPPSRPRRSPPLSSPRHFAVTTSTAGRPHTPAAHPFLGAPSPSNFDYYRDYAAGRVLGRTGSMPILSEGPPPAPPPLRGLPPLPSSSSGTRLGTPIRQPVRA